MMRPMSASTGLGAALRAGHIPNMKKLFVAHRPKTQSPEAGKQGPAVPPPASPPTPTAKETGGPQGPEPTRYGDWERKGICVDF